MRRFLLMLFAATILAALLLPAAASAANWTVKNANGKKIGTVHVFARPKQGVLGRVFDNKGHERGFFTKSVSPGERYYLAFHGRYAGDGSYRDTLRTQWDETWDGTSHEWSLYRLDGIQGEKSYVGRVEKRGGRWYPQVMGDFYHDMGYVSASAPAWAASGAVFCLHPWWSSWMAGE